MQGVHWEQLLPVESVQVLQIKGEPEQEEHDGLINVPGKSPPHEIPANVQLAHLLQLVTPEVVTQAVQVVPVSPFVFVQVAQLRGEPVQEEQVLPDRF